MNLVDRAVMAGARWSMRRAVNLDDSVLAPPEAPAHGESIGLYLHIPFCESLCPFCPFHRVHYEAPLAERYMRALSRELRHFADLGFRFGSIYVGGGTPTVVARQLGELLLEARALWPIRTIAVETNPNHLVPERLDPLLAAGVNRLSVGVQSFDDHVLERLGRLHPYGSGAELVGRIGAVLGRFETLNVDMMFNLPAQSRVSLASDLSALRALRPDQISYYPLMPPLTAPQSRGAGRTSGALSPADFDAVAFANERAGYEQICDALLPEHTLGSVWCFNRRPAAIDEYIVDEDSYVGLGSGAFSLIGDRLLASSFSIPDYIELVEQRGYGHVAGQHFSPSQVDQYRFLVKLFGLHWQRADLERQVGPGWQRRLAPLMQPLRMVGALRVASDGLHVTERGRYLWLILMREFLMRVNAVRREMLEMPTACHQPISLHAGDRQ